MSDKSFGDHMSRGIVKNPLLSTAVTGLSIEDLTQNAVLLPVSLTEELFGRQDQTGLRSLAPAHPDHPNIPSGDANFTPIAPPPPATQQNAKNDNTNANASHEPKTEDYFDVNEYFARLQGTRYVSAPINLKEDTNANLEATEDNLEEINLNEPDKGPTTPEDVQQSITADIAQNFSQLPTVLPQVASAVFTSFSNMLSMKSREQTPDEVRPVERPDDGVALHGVSEVKEVAPPPREPPAPGPGNFRIASKKKYAQIPGLSSGESAQVPSYAPPSFHQSFFSPTIDNNKNNYINITSAATPNIESNVFSDTVQNIPKHNTTVFETPKEEPVAAPQHNTQEPNASIIPPPPMFSNLAKRDSLSSAGKSLLPPSVARRLASNKPTINTQPPTFSNVENIFVPPPVTTDLQGNQTWASNSAVASSAPIATPIFAQTPPNSNFLTSNASQDPTEAFVPASSTTLSMPIVNSTYGIVPPPTTSSFVSMMSPTSASVFTSKPPIENPLNVTLTSTASTSLVTSTPSPAKLPPPPMFTGNEPLPLSTFTSTNSSQPFQVPAAKVPTVEPVPLVSATASPQIFNPFLQTSPSSTVETKMLEPQYKNAIQSEMPPTPETKITEPPKAVGNTNFRMMKKRPQYYSGPIEGVGAISNNVKPTLNPVDAISFQGAVFTPEIVPTGYQGENEVVAPTGFQGAIYTPDTSAQQDNPPPSTYQGFNIAATESHYVPGAQYIIDKQVEFPQFDNKAPAPTTYNMNYNIPFDVSRKTTDGYEPPKHESAFGILDSLKSKLTSLDINKIQSSVTTFFDPAYNSAKPEEAKEYQAPAYGQSQGGIEIFVPNANQQHVQPYNYDTYQTNFTYGQGTIPNPTDYYQQQVHNAYSHQSYYSEPNYGTYSYYQEDLQPSSQYNQQHINSQENQAQQNYSQLSNESFEVATKPMPIGSGATTVFDNIADESISYSHVHDKNINKTNDSYVANQKPEEPKVTTPIPIEESRGVQSNIVENQPEESVTEKAESIESVLGNLNLNNAAENNRDDFSSNIFHLSSNVSANVKSPFFDKSLETNTENDILEVLKNVNKPNYFNMSGNNDKNEIKDKVEESAHQDNVPSSSLFLAPLRDLSSIIATQQLSDGVSELADDVSLSPHSNEEEFDSETVSDKMLALADFSKEDSFEDSHQSNDLNICETCREVAKAEEKEADLTSQLIENITAPIQLLNPVEVPLPESHTIPVGFDAISQCAEISLIADETIETLQVQSASGLLDDKENTNIKKDYGWCSDSSFPPADDLLDQDYTFKINCNAAGFFGKNNLFFDNDNVSDELKSEFEVSQDDAPLVLQTQKSIPSATPGEYFGAVKSDVAGMLDVQSIEQDASNDFTVFEPFVIEPAESDDDKIRDKSTGASDTFTNRVDRFKKLESSEDLTEHKDFSAASVNTMMPSYFDTGNYAVEAHYRNSLTSPSSTVKSSDSNRPFHIPPGFEDGREDQNKNIEPKIPDTSTQTRSTPTLTFSELQTQNVSITSAAAFKVNPDVKLPDFAGIFGAATVADKTSSSIFGGDNTQSVRQPVNPTGTVQPTNIMEDKVKETKVTKLPDPINFFASTSEDTRMPDSANRLASYFASPPKSDSTKSFFELSQGQDHFRQTNDKKNHDINDHQPFFESSQSQNRYKDASGDAHDKYIANLNLMKDLTSFQYIETSKEQVVRTVNYFTVEYDEIDLNKGEPSIKEFDKIDFNVNKERNRVEKTLDSDESFTKAVNNCKYCCDLKTAPFLNCRAVDFDSLGKVRYKQAMDSGGATAKEGGNSQKERGRETTVNFKVDDVSPDGDNSEEASIMTENRLSTEYEAVKHHWFYRVDLDGKSTWRGFSTNDSAAIEKAFRSPELNESTLVATDGGRFDVNVMGRLRVAVYWNDKPTNVRRCSWFYKGTTDARYVPYTEPVAEKLEEEYRHGVTTGQWHRRLLLPNSELVVMHGPAVMVHFLQGGGAADAFSAPNLFTFGKRVYRNPPKFKMPNDVPTNVDHLLLLVHGAGEWRSQKEKIQSTMRPRVVRRGFDESEIEGPEPSSIDHLLLLCHGVGSACDMRFRSVEEVVDDFRATSLQLLQSHYRNSCDSGAVGRVEVLPISWHARLHAGPGGVDARLARLTLASIPRLRSFTNDTVLDVLFYTSPHYCQMILDTVCSELNRVYNLFKSRNPDFKGGVSLGGHSLGSVILYDLLCNQQESAPLYPSPSIPQKQYLSGTAAHNPIMNYPQLDFEPLSFYALGSPIAIFECIRGVESLGKEFRLPTCRNFFNIFHPYDPIAYRIEPLINPQLQNAKPSLIPHHKGRKRMHLELKETMARVGADLKQKLVASIRSTWSSVWAAPPPPGLQLQVVEEEIEKEQPEENNPKDETLQTDVASGDMLGKLNGGRRVDYVLQEAPFEMINEYLFAMTSHVCYWESEDTMLLILREIYDSIGVRADVTVPQNSMTLERTRNEEKLTHDCAEYPSTSRNGAFI